MDTPLAAPRPLAQMRRPSLRMITIAALVLNALVFSTDLIASGPNGLNLGHLIPPLLFAGLVAIRRRWTPALGALLGAVWLLDAFVFLTNLLIQPDSAASFAFAALFFATSLVALVAGVAATIQNYRTPYSRPFVDPPAPRLASATLLAFAALILGGILTTAIQPRSELPGIGAEALAALPALTTRDYQFKQTTITVRVGETVALRLNNADSSAHSLDIDEFNVHVPMPAGKSSLALFTPTQPGIYTFYCRPHADKAAGTGMVGTLVVEP
ncbi:MAG TPA: cupredoxin domain-containing protein [Roseiflexaceae bacterium]|nr:cupredoxin domain-containing protein [Roseiflexaceae bacterium]